MTSQSKKDAIKVEWEQINSSIDLLLRQLDPEYTDIYNEDEGKCDKSCGYFNGKKFQEELKKFADEEFKICKKTADKENKGTLDPEKFEKSLIENYTKHYRYRATAKSIEKLKRFHDYLCNNKENTISSVQMWPENANPILSENIVKFMRQCSKDFDKKKRQKK